MGRSNSRRVSSDHSPRCRLRGGLVGHGRTSPPILARCSSLPGPRFRGSGLPGRAVGQSDAPGRGDHRAEFVSGPDTENASARRVKISGDRVAELRHLFDGSRLDPEPARWAFWGKLRLFLKGGGTEVYDIYGTGKGPGAYSDHLRRYFRGGTDAAFEKFLSESEEVPPVR